MDGSFALKENESTNIECNFSVTNPNINRVVFLVGDQEVQNNNVSNIQAVNIFWTKFMFEKSYELPSKFYINLFSKSLFKTFKVCLISLSNNLKCELKFCIISKFFILFNIQDVKNHLSKFHIV